MLEYNKIEYLLSKNRMTLTEMAKIVGMSTSGFRDSIIKRTIKVDTLEKIAGHFGKPVSYFFNEEIPAVSESSAEYKIENNIPYSVKELLIEKDKLLEEKDRLIKEKQKIIDLLEEKIIYLTELLPNNTQTKTG